MGVKRLKKNKGLEPNLYPNGKYFVYLHPITRERHGMGIDRNKAIAAARQLNTLLMDGQSLVANVLGLSNKTMAEVINLFIKEYLPDRELAPKTLKSTLFQLNRLKKDLGAKPINAVDVTLLAGYLKGFTRCAEIKNRQLLIDIFRFACSQGFVKDNPAESTLRKKAPKRVRSRLTLEQYNAIYKHASPWLQNAMDLGLITLQRRYDIVNMRFDQIIDGHLQVVQSKTKKHGDAANLSIQIVPGSTLDTVIRRCRSSGIVSPFLVHAKPVKRYVKVMRKKTHWTEIGPEFVTRAFQDARNATKLFEKWDRGTQPTFHEIRALGGHLYEEQGFPKTYIQKLMGHTSAKMTDTYLDEHEIRWTQVNADLPITGKSK